MAYLSSHFHEDVHWIYQGASHCDFISLEYNILVFCEFFLKHVTYEPKCTEISKRREMQFKFVITNGETNTRKKILSGS